MVESMGEMLERDLQCENLLECFHGLSDLDRETFRVLVDADRPLTVDELAEAVDRERTTAYRSLRRLDEAGVVDREQRSGDGGSYYHVFSPADPDEVADAMQRLLNDWYATMGTLVAEFRETYADRVEVGADTDDEPERVADDPHPAPANPE
ncbi:winged helix DNA-binding protein [Salinirubellus salinus]|uniref:Winged helix DNA-binding protein n=1 Tax=Salinirubellus salinus TaxID=1364945 RepID=A0A9E7R7U7_9EURY|nr:helix-turn-helix domain-containing protein [Salinirubellus salinus]UWM56213.1 winged helix DNA-binding protein [Salinirubellus salinus]